MLSSLYFAPNMALGAYYHVVLLNVRSRLCHRYMPRCSRCGAKKCGEMPRVSTIPACSRQGFATKLYGFSQVWQDVDPWLSIKQRPCVLKAEKKSAKVAKAVAKAAQLAARPKAKVQRVLRDLWDLL